jgi:hypothetical protein
MVDKSTHESEEWKFFNCLQGGFLQSLNSVSTFAMYASKRFLPDPGHRSAKFQVSNHAQASKQ